MWHKRFEHRTAGKLALASGMPTQVLNLVMEAYGGSRLDHAHGAVAHPMHGARGLIAGCSFAKGVLKSFLLPVARRARLGKFRDSVDDIPLQTALQCPAPCAVITCS